MTLVLSYSLSFKPNVPARLPKIPTLAWNIKGDETKVGAQIDMLIIRDDNIVNLCEMKFSGLPYSIDKEEEAKMLYRVELLKESLAAKQKVHLTLITTYGLVQGKHSGKVQKVVTCDDLFV